MAFGVPRLLLVLGVVMPRVTRLRERGAGEQQRQSEDEAAHGGPPPGRTSKRAANRNARVCADARTRGSPIFGVTRRDSNA